MKKKLSLIQKRFRGFLPVVIDVETAGVNPNTDALLELAAVMVHPIEDSARENSAGEGSAREGSAREGTVWQAHESHHWHIMPAEGTKINPKALAINGIDPDHPFRFAIPEEEALTALFKAVNKQLNNTRCQRALLVGHNAHFDLNFIRAACDRCGIKKMPFHSFTCLDTATMSALVYGETVLAKALEKAQIAFDASQAHSAIYDTQVTAELFCKIVNHIGLPLLHANSPSRD